MPAGGRQHRPTSRSRTTDARWGRSQRRRGRRIGFPAVRGRRGALMAGECGIEGRLGVETGAVRDVQHRQVTQGRIAQELGGLGHPMPVDEIEEVHAQLLVEQLRQLALAPAQAAGQRADGQGGIQERFLPGHEGFEPRQRRRVGGHGRRGFRDRSQGSGLRRDHGHGRVRWRRRCIGGGVGVGRHPQEQVLAGQRGQGEGAGDHGGEAGDHRIQQPVQRDVAAPPGQGLLQHEEIRERGHCQQRREPAEGRAVRVRAGVAIGAAVAQQHPHHQRQVDVVLHVQEQAADACDRDRCGPAIGQGAGPQQRDHHRARQRQAGQQEGTHPAPGKAQRDDVGVKQRILQERQWRAVHHQFAQRHRQQRRGPADHVQPGQQQEATEETVGGLQRPRRHPQEQRQQQAQAGGHHAEWGEQG